jgi:hypothetical protein
MSRRAAVLAVLAGFACFALGVGATRMLGWGPPTAVAPAASAGAAEVPFPVLSMPDAGLRLVMPASEADVSDAGPRIVFDPDSITLLPDASLRLDLLGDAGGR